ncbi:hypothetical protein [Pseudomonas sp. KCJK9016]|uniref:hypothetical protein n=1 Tax=Pseudomonas sp. KCJK9016 TaxID=3344556 RepID=UPI003905B6C4
MIGNNATRADKSFVLNGKFMEGYSHWTYNKKGARDRPKGEWNGEEIRYLLIMNEAAFSQPLVLPRYSGATAAYSLRFLYLTEHPEPGGVEILNERTGERQLIELLPDSSFVPPSHTGQEDRVINFKEMEVPVGLAIEEGDKVIVTVSSPANPTGVRGSVSITRIELLMVLEPLVAEYLKLDEQTIKEGDKLYLCLGAKGEYCHHFSVQPVAGNPWWGTMAALGIIDNPQEAITSQPAMGEDQPIEAEWLLHCPEPDQENYELTLQLRNEYTAETCSIPASLGHHRLAIAELQQASHDPVLEYSEEVTVGVRIISHYTNASVSNRDVTFTLAGRTLDIIKTDAQGWARLLYKPADHGLHDITASVESRYYTSGVIKQSIPVLVHEMDPWKEAKALFEGMTAAQWGEKTGFPDRGYRYKATLDLPADSPLIGTEMSLSTNGDPLTELDTTVAPAESTPVPITGRQTTWDFDCGDKKDGQFGMQLRCSRLLRPSPSNLMLLARNRLKIGQVVEADKSPVVDERESVQVWIQVLAAISGEPVIGAEVRWQIPGSEIVNRTGLDGWASVLHTFTEPGKYSIVALVPVLGSDQPLTHTFEMEAQASSPWKGLLDMTLDGVPVEPTVGLVCWRGASPVLSLIPSPGSTLIGKPITLNSRNGVPIEGLTAEPDLGTPRVLPAEGLRWTLTAGDQSIRFGLDLHSDQLTSKRELSGRVVSRNFADEGQWMLDQIQGELDGEPFHPCIGALHRLRFLPHALSPLVGLPMDAIWMGPPLGIVVSPAPSEIQPVTAGGVLWSFDCSASTEAGAFSWAVAIALLGLESAAKPMQLGHYKLDLGAAREAAVDPVEALDESAVVGLRLFSRFTGQAVEGAVVEWVEQGRTSRSSPTDPRGWAYHRSAPAAAGSKEIEASVFSAYDGTRATQSFQIKTVAANPLGSLRMSFDGGAETLFGSETVFPRRKGKHHLRLFTHDSALRDQCVAIGFQSYKGPQALDIGIGPVGWGDWQKLGEKGLEYSLDFGDVEDASCSLQVAASRVLQLSKKQPMSLGEGSSTLKILLQEKSLETLEWGSDFHALVRIVSSITGKGLAGVKVAFESVFQQTIHATTNYYGEARVRFKPTHAGLGILTVRAGESGDQSTSLTLRYTVEQPRLIAELTVPDSAPNLGQEVTAQARVVSSHSGASLPGVEVMWQLQNKLLRSSLTDSQGVAACKFRIEEAGENELLAMVRGSLVGWDVMAVTFRVSKPLRMMAEFKGGGDYPIDELAPIEFRVVSLLDGEPIAGKEIYWERYGKPLEKTFSGSDGRVGRSFSSEGMVGYKVIRVFILDEKNNVLDEETVRIRFHGQPSS